jgi:superfamily II DNA or RNA helicase
MVASIEAGRRPLLVSPTGSGKSKMSRNVLIRVVSEMPRALALVHTRTLREQSKRTIGGAQIGTIQGLIAPGRAGDAPLSWRALTLPSWTKRTTAFKDWRQATALPLGRFFGATATPERGDGTPLGDAFDDLIVAAKYSELVTAGQLCPCDIAYPDMKRKEQKRKKVKPDAVKSYLKNGVREDGSFRPGIYFDRTKVECYEAAERFEAAGVRCRVITDETPSDERQAISTCTRLAGWTCY